MKQERLVLGLREKGAPLALTSDDLLTLQKIEKELERDEEIAQQDRRTLAPKSRAHIDARKDREVAKKRKALLREISVW